MSCLRMAAFGWRNTMNECACNGVSPHNGKDSLLHRLCWDSSRGENSVLVIRGVDVSWTSGKSILHLAIFSCCVLDDKRSTYRWANRAITFSEEGPLTLEFDWYQSIELTSSSTLHMPLWVLIRTTTLSSYYICLLGISLEETSAYTHTKWDTEENKLFKEITCYGKFLYRLNQKLT